jgi:hypothetical protein
MDAIEASAVATGRHSNESAMPLVTAAAADTASSRGDNSMLMQAAEVLGISSAVIAAATPYILIASKVSSGVPDLLSICSEYCTIAELCVVPCEQLVSPAIQLGRPLTQSVSRAEKVDVWLRLPSVLAAAYLAQGLHNAGHNFEFVSSASFSAAQRTPLQAAAASATAVGQASSTITATSAMGESLSASVDQWSLHAVVATILAGGLKPYALPAGVIRDAGVHAANSNANTAHSSEGNTATVAVAVAEAATATAAAAVANTANCPLHNDTTMASALQNCSSDVNNSPHSSARLEAAAIDANSSLPGSRSSDPTVAPTAPAAEFSVLCDEAAADAAATAACSVHSDSSSDVPLAQTVPAATVCDSNCDESEHTAAQAVADSIRMCSSQAVQTAGSTTAALRSYTVVSRTVHRSDVLATGHRYSAKSSSSSIQHSAAQYDKQRTAASNSADGASDSDLEPGELREPVRHASAVNSTNDRVYTASDKTGVTSMQRSTSSHERRDWHHYADTASSGSDSAGTHSTDRTTGLRQRQHDRQSHQQTHSAQQHRHTHQQQQRQQQQQQETTADEQSLAAQLQQAREELIALQYSLASGALAAAEPSSVSSVVRKHSDGIPRKHWPQQQQQQQWHQQQQQQQEQQRHQQLLQQQRQQQQQRHQQLQQQQRQQQRRQENTWRHQQQQRQLQELLREQRSQELPWRGEKRSPSPPLYAHRSSSNGSDDYAPTLICECTTDRDIHCERGRSSTEKRKRCISPVIKCPW